MSGRTGFLDFARNDRGVIMTGAERALLGTVRGLARRPVAERGWLVRRLTMPEKHSLDEFWPAWAHEGQLPPPAFGGAGFSTGSNRAVKGAKPTWTMMTGRGFGKTRAGAEWVSALARPSTTLGMTGMGAGTERPLRIALVAATIEEARKVMVEGRSGLLAVARTGEEVRFHKSDGVVRFASGAEAYLYSGANPESLRGPEHHFAWCDEIAKWRYPEETWANLQLGLRLGAYPRALVTTTPKAVPLLTKLLGASAVTRGRTADNLNLPEAFVARMEAELRGTRRGREELDGELIAEADGALWTRDLLERCRVLGIGGSGLGVGGSGLGVGGSGLGVGGSGSSPIPNPQPPTPFTRVVIGVDPPASAAGDACGIVACALGADGVAYVIGDHSERGLSPEGWAGKVVAAARAWGADKVVVEKNQGGEMVTSVLKQADPALPVRPVHARYGKGDRAEPVAMLFETGEAKLAGAFPELEDELCAMIRGGGYALAGSPDRADAMVWALSDLMLGVRPGPPRVRGF